MMLDNLLLFQAPDESMISTPILVVIMSVIGGLLGSGLTILAGRRKTNSETTRNNTETIILSGDKLITWIEKFETAKTEAIQMEDDMSELKRQLRDCFEYRGDCQQFLGTMKANLDELFTKLQTTLQDFSSKDDVIKVLAELRLIVNNKLDAVVGIRKNKQ